VADGIVLEAVTKTYGSGSTRTRVLGEVTLSVPGGQFVSIIGPSGSGKSTLLNLVAGLDVPTSGRVLVSGHDLGARSDDARSDLRLQCIGVVFQSYNLLPSFTVEENVLCPLEVMGEQQRAAIARALVTQPQVLLADEPTGNLDSTTGQVVLDLLRRLNLEKRLTVLLVTHSTVAAGYGDRTLELRDGRVVRDSAANLGGRASGRP